MNQHGKNPDWEDDGTADAGSDPWFRPVWEDLDDDGEAPAPLLRRPSRIAGFTGRRPTEAATALLGPLAAAQDALARLDARATLLSPAVQAGLVARLAYAEAAGLLAAHGFTAHPLDLALRAGETIGRRELWLKRPSASLDANLALDAHIVRALALVRLLHRLPSAAQPLAGVEKAELWLKPLARDPGRFDPARFGAWRAAHAPDGRQQPATPGLLLAADAALAWMESGVMDRPDAVPALAIAAFWARRAGVARVIPLPVWAGWPALGAPADGDELPRLRGNVAARLAPDGPPSWRLVFLHLVAEGARAGTRLLDGLRTAETAGRALAGGLDKRSRLGPVLEQLLRQPAVTAPALARRLEITPQAALRLLKRLVDGGVVIEVTGRERYQGFAIRGP